MEDSELSLRPTKCDIGVLSRADGSALYTQGDSVVLAAVYGPCEVKPQKLIIDRAAVDVIYKPKSGILSIADKPKESMLLNTCQTAILTSQHPRTSISVIVQEMQESGGLLACAINTACLALMDAGIPMKFLFAAVNSMVTSNNQILLDPDARTLQDSKAVFTIVFDGLEQNVVATETSGHFTTEQFQEVLNRSRTASQHMFQMYRDVVKKYADRIS